MSQGSHNETFASEGQGGVVVTGVTIAEAVIGTIMLENGAMVQLLVEAAGDPRYLDEASLAAPALGLQRARLEVGRLGELVLNMARRGPLVAIEGTQTDLEVLRTEDIEVGRLGSAILLYVGMQLRQIGRLTLRIAEDAHAGG